MPGKIRYEITHGLRGWFAVQCDDEGPIQSGIGGYKTPLEALQEARDWAMSEGDQQEVARLTSRITGHTTEVKKDKRR